jgi:hypothetical protein
MDVLFLLAVVLIIVAAIGVPVVAVCGTVDAVGQPRELWGLAGYERNRWVWQAAGIVCMPVAIAYTGAYFLRVRPRLLRVQGEAAVARSRARAALLSPSVAAEPPAEPIRIRMPWTVVIVMSSTPFVGAALGTGLAMLSTPGGGLFVTPWIEWGGLVLLGCLLNWSLGVTLTSEAAVLRGLRRRRIAWSDIVAITPQATLGSRYVRVLTSTGRSHRWRAPVAWLGAVSTFTVAAVDATALRMAASRAFEGNRAPASTAPTAKTSADTRNTVAKPWVVDAASKPVTGACEAA